MKIALEQQPTYAEYKRTKFNLYIILTEIGGLFTSLNIIGFLFTISFSYNLMISSLIRQLYWFKFKFPEERANYKKGKNKKNNYAKGRASRLDGWFDDEEEQIKLDSNVRRS